MTVGRVHAARPWVLPLLVAAFVAMAVLAAVDALPWDRAITNAVIDALDTDPRRPCTQGVAAGLHQGRARSVSPLGLAGRATFTPPRPRDHHHRHRPTALGVRAQRDRRPRPPCRQPARQRSRSLVPQRPPLRSGRQLGPDPTRRPALHPQPGDLVDEREHRLDDRAPRRRVPCLARRALDHRRRRLGDPRHHRRRHRRTTSRSRNHVVRRSH